ncbi:flavin-containing monooxygenase [Thalassomonas sp. M1454]|uniref:flavin-containing monooxygenase n=1 Tax=Thalassomonas sp. M1454 TaxID=2594477 RepID=UPI00117E5ED1|nr:NAD(P)/FAD-dependent oxidoreductase [Thalassomonas sp. M1454]TRX54928.1 potassium transporter Trk [Thalassomonas sp. M1454]
MYDFIVVGGSQAGLAMGYHLKQLGFNFIIVDSADEIGRAWLSRWDSLTLFTPKKYNALPGMKFEGDREYPNKHDVADYLKRYVKTFDLPVQLNTKVLSVDKNADIYQVHTNTDVLQCRNLVVATGPFHTPFIPNFAKDICSSIKQVHSRDYVSPAELNQGDTLVVGGGDSGVQILAEVADSGCAAYSSGVTSTASLPQTLFGKTLWWWLKSLGILSLSRYSYLGKQIKKRMQPVIGTNVKALLARDNVKALGRTLSANGTELTFSDAKVSSIKNIIWATGYKPDFSWLSGEGLEDIKFTDDGYPSNYRGIGDTQGMYFIGLPWMHTRGSATLGGVGVDAQYLAHHIAQQIQVADEELINCTV